MKLRYVLGAIINEMYDNIKPIHKRLPKYIFLDIGANDSCSSTANKVIANKLALKKFLVNYSKSCKVIISTLTMHIDSQKRGFLVSKVN